MEYVSKKLNREISVTGIVNLHFFDFDNDFTTEDERHPFYELVFVNSGRLFAGLDGFVPCTPKGIMKLIASTGVDISGKNAVVLGRSLIVGKPIALLLTAGNATVTICHSRTADLREHTLRADILVAAIGKPKFVTADMVKEGAVVIDVGINRTEEGLVGDVDFESVKEKAGYITPVPGGVGPMTIAMLMENTVISAERRNDK